MNMSLEEAKDEANRWLAYLQGRKDRVNALQRLAMVHV